MAAPERRIGLSRHAQVRSLHGSRIKSSTVAPELPVIPSKYDPKRLNRNRLHHESPSIMEMDDEDIFAPPKDSDDEEISEHEQPELTTLALKSTSRVNKLPTTSARQSQSAKGRESPSTIENLDDEQNDVFREQSTLSTSSQARVGSSQSSSNRSRAKRKGAAKEESHIPDSGLGAHMDWFESSQSNRPRKKRTTAYGSSQPKRQDASPEPKFKVRQTPIGSSPPPAFRSHKAEYLSPEPEDEPKFQVPPTTNEVPKSSPESIRQFKIPKAELGADDESLSDDPFLSSQIEPDVSIDDFPAAPFPSWEVGPRRKKSDSDLPIFHINPKVAALLKDDDIDVERLEQFSTTDIKAEKTPEIPTADIILPPEKPASICPMCGEEVDPEFLRSFNNGKRMNTRTQARFCEAHKKKAARDAWASSSYPVIEWDELDARIAKHHKFIKSILDGAPSYYRNVLDETVKSGKNRTLRQAVMNSNTSLTPGYYGSRGLRVISENLMGKFTSQLRRIVVKDKLMAARGVAGYVQSVLVPEVTVMLICEDMKVNADRARSILQESIVMGDLVNEEIEDVVTRRVEDEEDF